MSKDFLAEILTLKQKRIRENKQKEPDWAEKLDALAKTPSPYSFYEALKRDEINIIAEIKRASPSKGTLNDRIDIVETAKIYESNGACAISVLTEEDKFRGSLSDLEKVRQTVKLPILCKDFIFDEFQIYKAKQAGANAVLLIVAMLDEEKLGRLYKFAENLGLDALVEVHTKAELETATKIGAKIIGINNRNLHDFSVSLDVSRNLIKEAPKDVLMVSESGISRKEEIIELKELGFSGFLIGELFMRSADIRTELTKLKA
ncbi:MAG: indole-3-glycerol phosphate synthase TrpC [Acidobacteria bacterium]|jgi:indole-3-glycerol phosphate synthase|nr:MAG: indole-3-glycerol phosphate synthase TrpC [Acidobacteriota bacterium]GIU81173.1 MAG: indole-3-glycerol phosphate synthase [Pyrinomonadaceae bacterium]